jgi:hypothetical protein
LRERGGKGSCEAWFACLVWDSTKVFLRRAATSDPAAIATWPTACSYGMQVRQGSLGVALRVMREIHITHIAGDCQSHARRANGIREARAGYISQALLTPFGLPRVNGTPPIIHRLPRRSLSLGKGGRGLAVWSAPVFRNWRTKWLVMDATVQ